MIFSNIYGKCLWKNYFNNGPVIQDTWECDPTPITYPSTIVIAH